METLKTMNSADVADIIGDAIKPDFTGLRSVTGPCVVKRDGNCPDKNLPKPNCGLCPIALEDETTIAAELKENEFQVVRAPEKWEHTDEAMSSRFSLEGVVVTVEHSYGQIKIQAQ